MTMDMPLSERYQFQSTTESKKNDRSVFLMVTFRDNLGNLDRGILYEFKIKHGGGGQIIIGGIEQEEQVRTLGGGVANMALQLAAEFFNGEGGCYLECARFCSSSKLYLLRDTFDSGTIFDTTTTTQATTMSISSSSSFSRPIVYYAQAHGPLISAYGKLYYFADPLTSPHSRRRATFQCYDPTNDSWERLPRCPFYSSFGGMEFYTVGFAVYGGCILFSLQKCIRYQFEFLVYNIATQKWHKPKLACFDYDDYFPFYGRAVVVDDTIYAPTYATGDLLVIKFSLRWLPPGAGAGGGSYLIDYLTVLPGLEIVLPPPKSSLRCMIYSYYMVHLGDFEFCLVYNYNDPLYRKNLCITTFRIVRDNSSMQCIKTLHSTVADFYLPPNNNPNHILFSFTPDCDDDTQSKEYETATTVKPANHKRVGAFDDDDDVVDDDDDDVDDYDDDTKSQEDKSATPKLKSVEDKSATPKLKSVCAFDAKEVIAKKMRGVKWNVTWVMYALLCLVFLESCVLCVMFFRCVCI